MNINRKDDRVGEITEIIEAMGHESEKQGIRWTKHFMEQFDQRELVKSQIREDRLNKRSRFTRREYHRVSREILDHDVKELERPGPGWWVETGFNDRGVWLRLHDRFGRKWSRGFRPSGIPKVDLHLMNLYMGWTQDKMWEEENKKEINGVHLP